VVERRWDTLSLGIFGEFGEFGEFTARRVIGTLDIFHSALASVTERGAHNALSARTRCVSSAIRVLLRSRFCAGPTACTVGMLIRHMGTGRVIARRVRSVHVASCLVPLLACAACSFDTQPLFDSRTLVSSADAGTGHANNADSADAATSESGVSSSDGAIAIMPIDVSSMDASVCKPGAVIACNGGAEVTCNAQGNAVSALRCPTGCNSAGTACNACTAGIASCMDATTLLHCTADGKPGAAESCSAGCHAASAGASATCNACTPGKTSCQGNDLSQCSADGQISSTVTCPSGCDAKNAQCMGSRVVPSNLPPDACATQSTSDRNFSGTVASLDSDNDCMQVVQQADGAPELCIIRYRDFGVPVGTTVRVHGSRAMVLLATRNWKLEGTVSVSAQADQAGPGSTSTGAGVGHDAVGMIDDMQDDSSDLPANAGGGGAGYAQPGAAGGGGLAKCGQHLPCTDPGAGGAVYGSELGVPLWGGSNGGRNSAAESSSLQATPGGGGGALQLVACADFELGESALIDASGGGGAGGNPGTASNSSATPGAGAGGGSGGTILIEALQLSVHDGARIAANGGGGGGGAIRATAGGDATAGQPGQDGQLQSTPAAGGAAGGGNSQSGGVGGANDPPGAGGDVSSEDAAAGGGGGAAGRIRLNTRSGSVDGVGLVASPPSSLGQVLVE
jgi:hypothetical protein